MRVASAGAKAARCYEYTRQEGCWLAWGTTRVLHIISDVSASEFLYKAEDKTLSSVPICLTISYFSALYGCVFDMCKPDEKSMLSHSFSKLMPHQASPDNKTFVAERRPCHLWPAMYCSHVLLLNHHLKLSRLWIIISIKAELFGTADALAYLLLYILCAYFCMHAWMRVVFVETRMCFTLWAWLNWRGSTAIMHARHSTTQYCSLNFSGLAQTWHLWHQVLDRLNLNFQQLIRCDHSLTCLKIHMELCGYFTIYTSL